MKTTAVVQDFVAITQTVADHITQAIADEDAAAAKASLRKDDNPFEPSVLIPVTLALGDTTRAVSAAADHS